MEGVREGVNTMRRMACVAAVVLSVLVLLPTPRASAQEGRSSDLIQKYWDHDDQQALDVAWCESKYNENETGDDVGCPSCIGVFQIHWGSHSDKAASLGYDYDDMFDAGKNTEVAELIYEESGWDPWTCQP